MGSVKLAVSAFKSPQCLPSDEFTFLCLKGFHYWTMACNEIVKKPWYAAKKKKGVEVHHTVAE